LGLYNIVVFIINDSCPRLAGECMTSRYLLHGLISSFSLLCLSQAGIAADANAGKDVFSAQCALCHSAASGDNGGAQGPSLIGIYEREAAGDSRFPYSQAMQDADLHWDAATL